MTDKLTKYEKLQLKINISDMQIMRRDIYELIEYERQFNREQNARYRLMERVLAAGLKVIDLWEDHVDHMFVIDKKGVVEIKLREDLEQRMNKRLGLEGDNAGLRQEISALQGKLQNVRENNLNRDSRFGVIKDNFTEATSKHGYLTKKVKTAQTHSSVLKNALETGFSELENVISENQSAQQQVDLE